MSRYAGPERRRGVGGWIARLAHDVVLALLGFGYLVALIMIVALVGDGMGAL